MAKNTRFPASNEPLHIFQDDMFENTAPMTSHAPMPSVTKPHRRPLTSANSNIAFNALDHSFQPFTPSKPRPMSSHQNALASSHGNKLNMVAMAPPSTGLHATDSLNKKPFLSKFKTASQRQQPMAGLYSYGKENVHPQIFPAPPTIDLAIENYNHKPNGKRGLMDAAPIKDSRPTKKARFDGSSIPHPDSYPPIVDDGSKPPHSYAQLIGMAILRSPNQRLTLAQIYRWISNHYSFYNPSDAGWQNSIRHNLSLHKNFIKIERPKDDPGKGNYWGIEPGTESQFLKEKPTRKSAPTAENLPVMSTRLEPSRPAPPIQEPTLPPPIPVCQLSLPPLPTSQVAMSMPVEPSSDATIPISDNIGPDDAADKGGENDLSLLSPLPVNLHSSPPVSRHHDVRSNTPPPAFRNPASSIPRSHKRKFASMDDSGYISSLESSVMRSSKAYLLTSEADRPRIKRGRAEEEIARLRGSSPFSPTKSRSYNVLPPVSSSPLRQANESLMMPPLTPVVKMKPPVRPPPSVSPNTNLRMHRDKVRHMLQSPLRRVTGITDDVVPWSPAFNLDDTGYFDCEALPTGEFDIFQDFSGLEDEVFGTTTATASGSPVKRSVKRVRMDRAITTPALGDITNSAAKKSIASAPILKAPNTPAAFLETPSKVFEDMESPSKIFSQSPLRNQSPTKGANLFDNPMNREWQGFMMDPGNFMSHNTADVGDLADLDILQGFEKIGSGSQNDKGPRGGNNNNNKPGLGRSYSTAF